MLALRFARRELRGSGGLVFLFASIALGTAAIATIGLLSASVLDGIRENAKESIGGDVSLRLYNRQPPPEHLATFRAAGTLDLIAETRTQARRGTRTTLVELKIVGKTYPLYGTVRLDPEISVTEALERRNGVWGAAAGETLLSALDAKIGDTVTIGGKSFELRARIVAEPDRSLRAFTLGPRLIVAQQAMVGNDLVAPGLQTYWYSRIRIREGVNAADWISDFSLRSPHAGYRIVNADNGVPGAERALAMVSSLMTFATAGIFLIGCLGVAQGVIAWLDGKQINIAILKSLGVGPPLILRVYLAQIAGVAALGVTAGLLLGSGLLSLLLPMVGEWLPVSGSPGVEPLLIAAGAGVLATMVFSLLPLARAEVQTPQILFRGDPIGSPTQPHPRRMALLALLFAALVALLLTTSPLPVLTAIFGAASALVVALFMLLGKLTVRAARAAGHLRTLQGRPLLRLALGDLHRPAAPTVSLVMAIGICLTLIVAVDGLRRNSERHLTSTLPQTAPSLVVLNLDPDSGEHFDSFMASSPWVARWKRVPFLHAAITGLDGQSVADRHVPADVAFIVRGDRGVSWQAAPQVNKLVAGASWPVNYEGPPLASVDVWAADRLGVGIGDTLTLDILGSALQAKIVNLRRFNRAALDLEFPVLLSPFTVAPPHREIAAVWVAPAGGNKAIRDLQSELSRIFPTTPVVVVGKILKFLSKTTTQLGHALGNLAAATASAVLLVLVGSVAASRQRRLRQTVLLKTLGATRRQIVIAVAIEFTLIGCVACLAAIVLGNLAAWGAVAGLVDFRPFLAGALPWLVAAMVVPSLIGLIMTRWTLSLQAAQMLRRL